MKGMIANSMGPPQDEAPQDPAAGDAEAAAKDQGAAQDSAADENDPGFRQALQFAMSALYQNGAAKNIAEQLRKSQDIPSALASVAYEIVSITDERTNGSVSDDLLMLFVTYVVEEIVDIARASGVNVSASDIGQAIKQMILRYLGEQGVDTKDLQSAMDEFDTNSLNTMETGDNTPEQGGQPPQQAAPGAAAQPVGGAQQ